MNHPDAKTPKGTLLPMLDMRGKAYLEVKWRLVWFREEHPDWSITTEFTEINVKEQYAIAKATITSPIAFNPETKMMQGGIIATAHKMEDRAGFADYLEKAETGAIGRALAMCGYGTQFAPELEEGDRIVDAPVQRSTSTHSNPPSPTVPIDAEPLPGHEQFAELGLDIESVEQLASKSGKIYWRVSTDKGPMTSFVPVQEDTHIWATVKGNLYNGNLTYTIVKAA